MSLSSLPALHELVYRDIHASYRNSQIFLHLQGKCYSLEAMNTIVSTWLAAADFTHSVRARRLITKIEEALKPLQINDRQTAALLETTRKTHTLIAIDRPCADLLHAAKQKTGPTSRASTYEDWRHACDNLDLTDVCSALEMLLALSRIEDRQSAFKDLCSKRHGLLANTDLHPITDPESYSNILIIRMAQILFPLETMSDLVAVLFPQVTHTYHFQADDRKLRLEHVYLGNATNTLANQPIDRQLLRQLIIVGNTAIFRDDYEEFLRPAKRRKIGQTEDQLKGLETMRTHTPGLLDALSAQDKSLHAHIMELETPASQTATLKQMLIHLADAFELNGVRGKGTETQAATGASFALANFERDWALFTDMHNTDLGIAINNQLRALLSSLRQVTSCVSTVARHLRSFIDEANFEDRILLEQRQQRPKTQCERLPSGLATDETQVKLPTHYALKCAPEIVSLETLFPYLLEMPVSTYPLLTDRLHATDCLGLPDYASTLEPQQREALSKTLAQNLHRALSHPDFIAKFTANTPQQRTTLKQVLEGRIPNALTQIIEALKPDLQRLQSFLLAACGLTHNTLTYICNGLEISNLILTLAPFQNNPKLFHEILTAPITQGNNVYLLLEWIIAKAPFDAFDLVAKFYSSNTTELKSLLLSTRRYALDPILFSAVPMPASVTAGILSIFAGHRDLLQDLLLAKSDEGDLFFRLAAVSSDHFLVDSVIDFYADDLESLERLLLAKNDENSLVLHAVGSYAPTYITGKILRLFASKPQSLMSILLVQDPDGCTLASCLDPHELPSLFSPLIQAVGPDAPVIKTALRQLIIEHYDDLFSIITSERTRDLQSFINVFQQVPGMLAELVAISKSGSSLLARLICDKNIGPFLILAHAFKGDLDGFKKALQAPGCNNKSCIRLAKESKHSGAFCLIKRFFQDDVSWIELA